jgi:hypothetical protein
MISIKIRLLFIALMFLLIIQCLSIKIRTHFKSKIEPGNPCFEIIKQNGQDFSIKSFDFLDTKNKNLQLLIKLKYTCEEPEFSHIIIDSWSLNGKMLSENITPSIQGTDCFITSKDDLGFLDTRMSWLLYPSEAKECDHIRGKEFTITFMTEYKEIFQNSNINYVKVHAIDLITKGAFNVSINLLSLAGKECQSSQKIIYRVSSVDGKKIYGPFTVYAKVGGKTEYPSVYNVDPGNYKLEILNEISCPTKVAFKYPIDLYIQDHRLYVYHIKSL